jgi:hypothetical protein
MWCSWFKIIVPITDRHARNSWQYPVLRSGLPISTALSNDRFPVAFYTVAAFKTCTSVYGLLIAYQPYY